MPGIFREEERGELRGKLRWSELRGKKEALCWERASQGFCLLPLGEGTEE